MTRCVQGYGHRFTDGDAYIDVITWLYDRRDISSFRRKEMQRYAVALDIAIDFLLVQSAAVLRLRSQLQCNDSQNLCPLHRFEADSVERLFCDSTVF